MSPAYFIRAGLWLLRYGAGDRGPYDLGVRVPPMLALLIAALLPGCVTNVGGAPLITPDAPSPEPTSSFRSSTPFDLAPIVAKFDQSCFCTTYSSAFDDDLSGTGRSASTVALRGNVSYKWTLELKIIPGDAGKPDPSLPDSRAAVDFDCNNAGDGTTRPIESRSRYGYREGTLGQRFTWVHPDPANSDPPGRYNCDHMRMGPHGHQGIVTLSVTQLGWTCTESYLGTNSGSSKDRDQEPFGTPTCAAVGPTLKSVTRDSATQITANYSATMISDRTPNSAANPSNYKVNASGYGMLCTDGAAPVITPTSSARTSFNIVCSAGGIWVPAATNTLTVKDVTDGDNPINPDPTSQGF